MNFKIIDCNSNLEKIYDFYILNCLNFNINFFSIEKIGKIIRKNKKNMELFKENFVINKKNTNWFKVSSLSLYKDITLRGIYFPFFMWNNFITFGLHRLYSIYLFSEIIPSDRLLPVCNLVEKKIILFLPNVVQNFKYIKNLYEYYDFDNNNYIIKKDINFLYQDEYVTLILHDLKNNYIFIYLLSDILSKVMYDNNKMIKNNIINCNKYYNNTNLKYYKIDILKKYNINIGEEYYDLL